MKDPTSTNQLVQTITNMKFDRKLVRFEGDNVWYDGIKLSITRQNIFDYVQQTDDTSESIILFYYKKELSQLRDKRLEEVLNEKRK